MKLKNYNKDKAKQYVITTEDEECTPEDIKLGFEDKDGSCEMLTSLDSFISRSEIYKCDPEKLSLHLVSKGIKYNSTYFGVVKTFNQEPSFYVYYKNYINVNSDTKSIDLTSTALVEASPVNILFAHLELGVCDNSSLPTINLKIKSNACNVCLIQNTSFSEDNVDVHNFKDTYITINPHPYIGPIPNLSIIFAEPPKYQVSTKNASFPILKYVGLAVAAAGTGFLLKSGASYVSDKYFSIPPQVIDEIAKDIQKKYTTIAHNHHFRFPWQPKIIASLDKIDPKKYFSYNFEVFKEVTKFAFKDSGQDVAKSFANINKFLHLDQVAKFFENGFKFVYGQVAKLGVPHAHAGEISDQVALFVCENDFDANIDFCSSHFEVDQAGTHLDFYA